MEQLGAIVATEQTDGSIAYTMTCERALIAVPLLQHKGITPVPAVDQVFSLGGLALRRLPDADVATAGITILVARES